MGCVLQPIRKKMLKNFQHVLHLIAQRKRNLPCVTVILFSRKKLGLLEAGLSGERQLWAGDAVGGAPQRGTVSEKYKAPGLARADCLFCPTHRSAAAASESKGKFSRDAEH
jgi:hypothetical protein